MEKHESHLDHLIKGPTRMEDPQLDLTLTEGYSLMTALLDFLLNNIETKHQITTYTV